MAIDIGWDATTLTYSKAINELLEKNEGIEKDALPFFADTDTGFLDFAMDAGVHFDTEKLMAAYAMTELDFPTFLAGPRQSGNTTFAYQMIVYYMRYFNTRCSIGTLPAEILVICHNNASIIMSSFCEFCEAYVERNKKSNNIPWEFKFRNSKFVNIAELGRCRVNFVTFNSVSVEDQNTINYAEYGISPNAGKRSESDNYEAVYKTSENIARGADAFVSRMRGQCVKMIVLLDYLYWTGANLYQYEQLLKYCPTAEHIFGASSYDDLNDLSNSKFLEYQLAKPVIGSNAHFYKVFNPKTKYQFLFDYMNFENRGVLVLPESEAEFAQKMFFKPSPFVLQL